MQRRPKITWRRPLAVLFGLTVLLALDGSGLVRVGLGCAILHESGHALAYRALWGHWPELEVSPFGICLRLRGLPMTARQELLLAAAGPLANLLACAAVLLFMRGAGYSYGGYWFACCNLLVGGSNLLPPARPGWLAHCGGTSRHRENVGAGLCSARSRCHKMQNPGDARSPGFVLIWIIWIYGAFVARRGR